MKQKFAYTLVTSLGSAAAAPAAPSRYREQALALRETLFIEDAGPRYYRDVRMAANADGSLAVLRSERRALARVHDISLLMLPGLPLELSVEVHGDLSPAAGALETPLVVRNAFTFTVTVTETPCEPWHEPAGAVADFVINVPLDVEGLPPGDYRVAVNGVEKRFTLGAECLPAF